MSRHQAAEGWVAQAYRFALDPTPSQARAMASHVGGARFAYNWGVHLVESRLGERPRLGEQALVEGLPKREADALVEGVGVAWNLYALRREWNASKDRAAPWWAANSKEAYSSGLDGLARALGGYLDSASGKRRGPRVGCPRRKKRRSRASCRFTTGRFGVTDAHHIRLPRIGVVKTHEPTVKLRTKLADGRARILAATLSIEAGRWLVSFTCEVCREAVPQPAGPAVGVDAGNVGGGRHLPPQLQDLLGLRLAKAKPVADRADVSPARTRAVVW